MEKTTCLFILGMHRCGTSAVAGSLKILGIECGDRLFPPRSDNPKGFFEHEALIEINERLFDFFGTVWYDEIMFDESGDWLCQNTAKIPEKLFRDAEEFILTEFSGSNLFFLKDPRNCITLPFWKRVFKNLCINAKYLLVLRAPGPCALSLKKRNGLSPPKSSALWIKHYRSAERNSREEKRACILFDALIHGPTQTLKNTLDKLELGIDLRPDIEASERQLRSFLELPESDFPRHSANESSEMELAAQTFFQHFLNMPKLDISEPDFQKETDILISRFLDTHPFLSHEYVVAETRNYTRMIRKSEMDLLWFEDTMKHLNSQMGRLNSQISQLNSELALKRSEIRTQHKRMEKIENELRDHWWKSEDMETRLENCAKLLAAMRDNPPLRTLLRWILKYERRFGKRGNVGRRG